MPVALEGLSVTGVSVEVVVCSVPVGLEICSDDCVARTVGAVVSIGATAADVWAFVGPGVGFGVFRVGIGVSSVDARTISDIVGGGVSFGDVGFTASTYARKNRWHGEKAEI